MYINQFELTGIPEFYARDTKNTGEFHYVGGVLAFFPYPHKKNRLSFPQDETGELLPITAKGFYHSEEYEEEISCAECGEVFTKTLGISYICVSSFHEATPENYLTNEKIPAPCNGTIMGDVHSVKTVEGKERIFHMVRLAVKDTTAPLGFSYITVSSLHPFTVDKGDHLCIKGKLVTTGRPLNLTCPACQLLNVYVNDSIILHAAAVQSLNTLKGYFGD